jgi:hypothetical protein
LPGTQDPSSILKERPLSGISSHLIRTHHPFAIQKMKQININKHSPLSSEFATRTLFVDARTRRRRHRHQWLRSVINGITRGYNNLERRSLALPRR